MQDLRAGGDSLMDCVVLTDERLDELGARFLRGRVRELTGVRFERYIQDPDYYDRMARLLRFGYGLRVIGDRVFVIPPAID